MAMLMRNASIISSGGIGTRRQAKGGISVVKSQSCSLVYNGSATSRSGSGASRSGHRPKLELGRGRCARMVVMSRSSRSERKNKQQEDVGFEEPEPALVETVPDEVEASASGLVESQNGKVESDATRNNSTDAEFAEDIRTASELRKARAALRSQQDPALTTDFWKGVVQETTSIEWPAFSRILGTTRVVVAMIVGSSVVLLTVNAVLAATSEYLLSDPGFRSLLKTYLNLAF